ncbi:MULTISPECIES: hypothetical protein [unclassified Arthrobacter]|uniref:hypothetical protein n=1 Tax=unclassified Arthrobacter TaxID=235627 RepID=UPI002E149469|nr:MULTISPECIES: hypothetical protein [unclassified Arthrobacter]
MAPAARGTGVLWTSEDTEPGLEEHLLSIEENLPEGVMYDHGLTDAAEKAGLTLGGKKELRGLVCVLDRYEAVRAVGKGQLNDESGFVVLTGERLVFVANCDAGSKLLLDAPHNSIEKLVMGKRTSGETIRVALSGRAVEISRLGHGEGHGIATSYREVSNERARTTPITSSEASIPGQNDI